MSVEDVEIEKFELEKFARHVPSLLSHQMIANLLDQFVNLDNTNTKPLSNLFACVPSISRFYGALLFVDISGFTALSQQLPVDELKIHINTYFRKIIMIVEKHGGDVVKFAGDALYVVWQSKDSSGNSLDNYKEVIGTAVRCGLEINAQCTNYKITFSNRDFSSNQFLAEQPSDQKADCAYLNVHAGVSAGIMAGMDVGAQDRWEYLIFGKPLSDVALAESEAEKGEVVISEYAHNFLCGSGNGQSEECKIPIEDNFHNPDRIAGGCTCVKTKHGYKISPHMNLVNLSNQVSQDEEEHGIELTLYKKTLEHAQQAFESVKERILSKIIAWLYDCKDKELSPCPVKQRGEFETNLLDKFLKWTTYCLTDDFARHVHEADRGNYSMRKITRINCLIQSIENHEIAVHSRRNSLDDEKELDLGGESFRGRVESFRTNANESSFRQSIVSPTGSENSFRQANASIKSPKHRNSLRTKSQQKHETTIRKDRDLNGEIRSVIVMFISIKSESRELLFTQTPSQETDILPFAMHNFDFLMRSPEEREADDKILARYQICLEKILTALKDKGGQLRQFIVDDKGTVCIGTFGLRGSVTYDNAAASVEAAQEIINNMRALGLDAGIGITSGKAYCGIVGSSRRHEYAVMGPSTNLSARLMAQAKPGEIVCDVNIRQADRLHAFRKLNEVKAKGYLHPVPTFRPVFMRGTMTGNMVDSLALYRLSSVDYGEIKEGNEGGLTTRLETNDGNDKEKALPKENAIVPEAINDLQGRENEMSLIIKFFFETTLVNPSDISSFLHRNEFEDEEAYGAKFLCDKPSKFFLLEGPNGMGKTAMLNSFSKKLRYWQSNINLNVQFIVRKSHNFDLNDPLKACKYIARNLMELYYSISIKNEHSPVNYDLSLSLTSKVETKDQKALLSHWQQGINFVLPYLPEDLQHYIPLFTSLQIISGFPDNQYTSTLSGAEKISKMILIITKLISLYPEISKNILFLIFDDIQFMDSSSWQVMKTIFLHNTGVFFLASYLGKLENSEVLDAFAEGDSLKENGKDDDEDDSEKSTSRKFQPTSPSSSNHNIMLSRLESLLASERYTHLELPALGPAAIKGMVDKLFSSLSLSIVDNEVYEKLEEMSGGNPLYIYELGKAMLERYKTLKKTLGSSFDASSESIRSVQHDTEFSGDFSANLLTANLPLTTPNNNNQTNCHDEKRPCLFKKILGEFRINRIDEVIYFRFDRLDVKSQLLLKLASVACASGSHQGFTLPMLFSMLTSSTDDRVNPVTDVFADIKNIDDRNVALRFLADEMIKIIQTDEFIKVQKSNRRSSSVDSEKEMLYSANIVAKAVEKFDMDNYPSSPVHRGMHAILPSINQAGSLKLSIANEENSVEDSYEEFLNASFSFKISLERQTIYDLMLVEQKESLHDRVASYLEEENIELEKLGILTSNHLYEEAYHWEKATLWGNAMHCYFRAAMLLDSIGAYIESYQHLLAAYRMLNALRKDAGLIEKSAKSNFTFHELFKKIRQEFNNFDLEATSNDLDGTNDPNALMRTSSGSFKNPRSKIMKQASMELLSNAANLSTPHTTNTGIQLTKQDIIKIFGGDSHLFEVGLQVLLRLAQVIFTLDDNLNFARKLYDEALQYIMITWRLTNSKSPTKEEQYAISNSMAACHKSGKYRASIVGNHQNGNIICLIDPSKKEPITCNIVPLQNGKNNESTSQLNTAHEILHRTNSNADIQEHFGLKDPSICFPILSGIAGMYRNKRLKDDPDHSKERTLYEVILFLAKINPEYLVHQLLGLCLMHAFYLKKSNIQLCMELTEEIHSSYRMNDHSKDLIAAYGNDRVPFTLAMNIQILIMRGDLISSLKQIDELQALGTQITHLHSLGTLAIPLSAALLLLNRTDQAKEVFQNYHQLEVHRGTYSFFKEANILFEELFASIDKYVHHRSNSLKFSIATSFQTKENFSSASFSTTSSATSNNLIPSISEFFSINDITSRIIRKEFLITRHHHSHHQHRYSIVDHSHHEKGVALLEEPVNELYPTNKNYSLLHDAVHGFGMGVEFTSAVILYMKAKQLLTSVDIMKDYDGFLSCSTSMKGGKFEPEPIKEENLMDESKSQPDCMLIIATTWRQITVCKELLHLALLYIDASIHYTASNPPALLFNTFTHDIYKAQILAQLLVYYHLYARLVRHPQYSEYIVSHHHLQHQNVRHSSIHSTSSSMANFHSTSSQQPKSIEKIEEEIHQYYHIYISMTLEILQQCILRSQENQCHYITLYCTVLREKIVNQWSKFDIIPSSIVYDIKVNDQLRDSTVEEIVKFNLDKYVHHPNYINMTMGSHQEITRQTIISTLQDIFPTLPLTQSVSFNIQNNYPMANQ